MVNESKLSLESNMISMGVLSSIRKYVCSIIAAHVSPKGRVFLVIPIKPCCGYGPYRHGVILALYVCKIYIYKNDCLFVPEIEFRLLAS